MSDELDTSELEKLSAVSQDRASITEFLSWAQELHGARFTNREGVPYLVTEIDELAWKFLEIDPAKVHAQREALLKQVQEQANEQWGAG